MCLYYSIPKRVSILSEVSGHFSGSINSEKKVEMQQNVWHNCLQQTRGAYPSPAFSEKCTGRHFSQLVWVADAEINAFGGISARNAVLVYLGEKGCKLQRKKKKVKPVRTGKNAVLDKNFGCVSRKGKLWRRKQKDLEMSKVHEPIGRPRNKHHQKE